MLKNLVYEDLVEHKIRKNVLGCSTVKRSVFNMYTDNKGRQFDLYCLPKVSNTDSPAMMQAKIGVHITDSAGYYTSFQIKRVYQIIYSAIKDSGVRYGKRR